MPINSGLSYLFDDGIVEILPDTMQVSNLKATIRLNLTKFPSLDNEIKIKIQGVEEQLQELEGLNRSIADLSEKLGETERAIEDITTGLSIVTEKERRIKELDDKRFGLWKEGVKKIGAVREFFLNVIQQFESDKDEILADLRFEPIVSVKTENVIASLGDRLDNRSMSISSLRQEIMQYLMS